MKNFSKMITAVILALITAALIPAQVFAESPDYISEIKIFEGGYSDAQAEGYTILKDDDGKPVDLNQGSGATGIGAKGNKSVYLGYKTTKDKDGAVTDLALMNMKGGYDVAEYEKLMEGQMSQEIVPFVDNFLTAINEYRANFNSTDTKNKQRAQYIHDVLNKFTDDDTDGAGLGDLLLNETVYEMAKPQWDALTSEEKANTSFYEVNNKVLASLSDTEKNQHADILTIIAQSNGKATLMLKNLLTRAADTSDDTWLERFENTTYDDLMEYVGGSSTDARKKLAKMYDDSAKSFLTLWEDFRNDLLNYDEYNETVESFDNETVQQAIDKIENLPENASEEETLEAAKDYAEAQNKTMEMMKAAEIVLIHDILEDIDCADGSMLDFFLQEEGDIEDDLTVLYPIIASLSDGQRAGLDFVTIRELMVIALSEPEKYTDASLDSLEETSVYEGVDRAIYQKGGVALTSDALRADALAKSVQQNEDTTFSTWTIVMAAVTGACFIAFAASGISWGVLSHKASYWTKVIDNVTSMDQFKAFHDKGIEISKMVYVGESPMGAPEYKTVWLNDVYASKAAVAKYLTVGLGVAMIVLGAVTTYLSYRDMKAHYKVDFTPIPHYMVDAKDLIGYNAKGERIVLKNQSAYYKAVESNRKKGDSYFNDIGNCADMNGCVNPQWLALYAAKNETENPILASSLKAIVGSSTVPSGYKTGIHMFGESAAFNLNSKLYCWNENAKSVMVYYKADDSAVNNTTGSNFSGGMVALAAGAGVALGAVVTALAMNTAKKKKGNKAVEA